MRRLLIFSFLMIMSSPVFAGTISIQPFISGNDVTIARLESQRTTLSNVINGNIEGGINIKAGSLVSQDFSNAVSIVTFRDEAFNNFTFTGMVPATSANLTSDISSGTSYVDGIRIQKNAESHTYTASKDTYVYIHSGGYYVYQEVANGAAAPSDPANTLLLAKVVTSGTAITSVSDLRTTSIQITVNSSNFSSDYRNGALVVRDSTTAFHVEPGQISIGNSNYTNTSDTSSKTISTGTNWIEGSAPNLVGLKFYVYAYNNSGTGFDFKYASADPVYSDASGNSNGTLRYYTTGGTTYRALAWISGDPTGVVQSHAYSQLSDKDTRNHVYFKRGTAATGTTAIPDDDTNPEITDGDEYFEVAFRPTNANNKVKIDVQVNGSASATVRRAVSIIQDTTTNAIASWRCTGPNDTLSPCIGSYEYTPGNTNLTRFKVRAGVDAGGGTFTLNGETGGRKFGGALYSFISVTEIES